MFQGIGLPDCPLYVHMVLLLFYLIILSLSAGESKSKATRLKLVLNALWEVRADWERIADQLISPGSREVNFKY